MKNHRDHNVAKSLVTLTVTYAVVKLLQYLAGFDYDIFEEGVFTPRFLIDVLSWAGVYLAVSYLTGKLYAPKKEAA